MKSLLPVDGSEAALEAVKYTLRLLREGPQASLVLTTMHPLLPQWA